MDRRCWFYTGVLIVAAMVAGCAPLNGALGRDRASSVGADLVFAIASMKCMDIAVDGDREFRVNLGVRNRGQEAFAGDKRFAGQMTLRYAESGELRASADVFELPPLQAGETVWPLSWHGELAPGVYSLSWGAEGYGEVTFEFDVVERAGCLYLEF